MPREAYVNIELRLDLKEDNGYEFTEQQIEQYVRDAYNESGFEDKLNDEFKVSGLEIPLPEIDEY